MSPNEFLGQLHAQTLELRRTAASWKDLPAGLLLEQPAPGCWSAAQCLDHLNGYGSFYLPLLERSIGYAGPGAVPPPFRSGWLGAYFANMMEPRPDGRPKSRMRAFAKHIPSGELDAASVLRTFLEQQDALLGLLERGRGVNLNRRSVPLSIAAWLKLKTGDVFRFLVAHNRRHLEQARRALATAGDRVPGSLQAVV